MVVVRGGRGGGTTTGRLLIFARLGAGTSAVTVGKAGFTSSLVGFFSKEVVMAASVRRVVVVESRTRAGGNVVVVVGMAGAEGAGLLW